MSVHLLKHVGLVPQQPLLMVLEAACSTKQQRARPKDEQVHVQTEDALPLAETADAVQEMGLPEVMLDAAKVLLAWAPRPG